MITWPRWIEKLVANWFGYFWLPCPVCGRMFSGREICRMVDRGEQVGTYKEDSKDLTAKVCCPKHQEDYYRDEATGRSMQRPPRHLRRSS